MHTYVHTYIHTYIHFITAPTTTDPVVLGLARALHLVPAIKLIFADNVPPSTQSAIAAILLSANKVHSALDSCCCLTYVLVRHGRSRPVPLSWSSARTAVGLGPILHRHVTGAWHQCAGRWSVAHHYNHRISHRIHRVD